MNGKYHTDLIMLLIIICVSMYFGCTNNDVRSETNKKPLTEFGKIIAQRPAPDLDTLAERSSPGHEGTDATEAFYDILKLRDVGNAKAVPVLEKIIEQDNYQGRIHSYAAAQALFCIGTEQAHKVLSKYLLTSKYQAESGINYAFVWEMNVTQRKDFIEQYHLKKLSQDLAIKLGVEKNKDEKGQRLDFMITLTNISKGPYRIRDKQVYLAKMLFVQYENGQFAQWFQPIEYDPLIPKWIELTPGQSHKYNFSVHIKKNGSQKLPYFGKDKNVEIMLETFDMICGIAKPSKCKVSAIVEEEPFSKDALNRLGLNNPWSGRAVSEPIVVDIGVE
jgi:hypothetical protein